MCNNCKRTKCTLLNLVPSHSDAQQSRDKKNRRNENNAANYLQSRCHSATRLKDVGGSGQFCLLTSLEGAPAHGIVHAVTTVDPLQPRALNRLSVVSTSALCNTPTSSHNRRLRVPTTMLTDGTADNVPHLPLLAAAATETQRPSSSEVQQSRSTA